MERQFGQKSRFYYGRSRYIMNDRDFIINGRVIYESSRFIMNVGDIS